MWKINILNVLFLIFYIQNIYASPFIIHNDHPGLKTNKLIDDKKSIASVKDDIKMKHSDLKRISEKEYDSYDNDYYEDGPVKDKTENEDGDVKYTLDEFIDSYVEKNYDKHIAHDILDRMQGDDPAQIDFHGAPKSYHFKPTGYDSSEEKKAVTENVYDYHEDMNDYQNDEGTQNEQPILNNAEIAKPSSDYYMNPNLTHRKIVLSYKNDSEDIYIPQFNAMLSKLVNSSNNYNGQDDAGGNLTEAELRKRYRSQTKEDWKQELKKRILETIGPDIPLNVNSNRSIIPNTLTNTGNEYSNNSKSSISLQDIPYTEKKQSFYPKCEIPRNTDLDSWNHQQNMNLNFNVNISSQIPNNLIVAKATLRLFQFYQNNSLAQNLGTAGKDTSESLNILDAEDKQIRVSVYWYTKSLKKHRIKRRLSDSKMISVHENSSSSLGKWVEFNIRPAAKSWIKSGRNHGLGIVIEDQDGNTLQTDKYFKNVDCSISESDVNKASSYFALFKPPPRPLFEAAVYLSTRKHNGNGNTNDDADDSDSKRNFTNADDIYNFILFPTIDLCTLEIPLREKHQIDEISSHACTFKTINFNQVNHVDVANYLYDKKHEPNGDIENFERASSSYTADTFRVPMTVSLTPDDDNYAIQNDEATFHKDSAGYVTTTVVSETVPSTRRPNLHHLRHHHDRVVPKYLLSHDPRGSIVNQTLILTYDEILKYLNSKSNATVAQR